MADGDARALSEPELRAVAELWRRTGREVSARFTGRSMEPTIPSGSEVRLACGAPPGVGDVVAFIRDGHIVLHRVEALSPAGRWILTRGDACLLPDPPLTDRALVLGRATSPLAAPPRGWGRRLTLALCLLLLRRGGAAGLAVVARLRHLSRRARRSPLAVGELSPPPRRQGT
jgi:hypothetical protein